MTYEEYAQERDAVISGKDKGRIYGHVAQRFRERFSIDCAYGTWTRYSWEAATRHNCEKVASNRKAVFLRRDIDGCNVILVYNRDVKCVVTVLTEPMVSGYIDRKNKADAHAHNAQRNRRLKVAKNNRKRPKRYLGDKPVHQTPRF